MKKNYIVLLLAIFFSGIAIAQESQKNFINYQGVARNADNSLMSSEEMTINIALKFGNASATSIYEESHAVSTDANGVFSLLIGNGSPTKGNYNALPWGSAATFVTVFMNGTEIGTTEMMAVPYALSSGDADDQSAAEVLYDNSASGLSATTAQEAIDELSTGGTIDADADPSNELQTLNFDAVTNELSLSGGNTVTIPSGGTDADADPSNELQTLSFDAGTNELSLSEGNSVTIPSGGTDADADPTNEIQTLSFDAASYKISLTDGGEITIPSGGTDADADPTNEFQNLSFDARTNELSLSNGNSIVIPSGGVDGDGDATNEIQTISFDAGTNELSLTDGGTVTIPSGGTDADSDPENEIDVTRRRGLLVGDDGIVDGLVGTTDGQVAKWDAALGNWVAGTDETGAVGGSSSGLEVVEEGGRSGWRLVGRDAAQYGDTGNGATDLSESDVIYTDKGATGSNSFAAGFGTKASGNFSVAMGNLTAAIGTMSTAMGESTIASGMGSTAMGVFTIASGDASTVTGSFSNASGRYATAIGLGSKAVGNRSTAMGDNTTANAYVSTSIGAYNIGEGDPENNVATDPIFEIGNGTSDSNRSNALTVLKNGNTGVGVLNPSEKLEVEGTMKSTDLAGTGQRNVMADSDGNLVIGSGGGGSSLWEENGSNISYSAGNIGMGTVDPKTTLDIAGGQWDLNNTNGDFRIGNETRGLRIGVATGVGLGGGDVRLRAQGGTDRLLLGAGNEDRITITPENVGIGVLNPSERLHVNGRVRLSNLEGIGTRNVMADQSGNLVVESPTTKSILIGANQFAGEDIQYNHGFAHFSEEGVMFTYVDVPDGSVIEKYEVYYHNDTTDESIDISMQIYKHFGQPEQLITTSRIDVQSAGIHTHAVNSAPLTIGSDMLLIQISSNDWDRRNIKGCRVFYR